MNTPGSPREAAFAGLYFLIGRHTGLIFYFPAAILLLWLSLRRGNDAVGFTALFAFFATYSLFVGWKPDNYFGGETFLGNRYLISYYPLLLFAVPRLPSWRQLLLPWLIALPCYAGALYSEVTQSDAKKGSQSHTSQGVSPCCRSRPARNSSKARSTVSWAGQLVRFVSPPAQVNSVNFVLSSEDRATEIMLAQWEIPSLLRFMVSTPAADATFEVEDFWRRQSFDVGQGAAVHTLIGVPVDLRPSRPWRRYLLWFSERPYYVRVLKLRLRSPQPAKAMVTFSAIRCCSSS